MLLLAATTASAGKVEVGFDENVDFGAFRTYGWTKSTPANSRQAQEWIVHSIERELEAGGLTKLEDGEPDLLVASHVVASIGATAGAAYIGLPTWGGGVIISDPSAYTQGTLIVDLIEPDSEEAVWRGMATQAFEANPNMGKAKKKVEKLITKLFSGYPPKN